MLTEFCNIKDLQLIKSLPFVVFMNIGYVYAKHARLPCSVSTFCEGVNNTTSRCTMGWVSQGINNPPNSLVSLNDSNNNNNKY